MILRLLICAALLFTLSWNVGAENEEISLQAYLDTITNSIYARPVKKASVPTKLQMSFFLEHILSVDSSLQTVTLSGLLVVSWKDERMQWNKTEYGNIVTTRRGVSQVWCPQFFIANSAGDPQRIVPDTQNDQVTVFDNGRIYFETKIMTITSCTMNVQKFPKDNQYCKVKFSIEGYTRDEIEISAEHGYDTGQFYIPSQEWSLNMSTDLGNFVTSVTISASKANSLSLSVPQYVFWIKIGRNPSYYYNVIVYPLIMLAILLILCFFIPVESGEKISLGITILLAFTVYMLLMDGLIPKTNVLPYLSDYLTGLLAIATVTLCLSGIVLRIYHIDPRFRMPDCVYTFFIMVLGTMVSYFGCCRKAPRRINADNKSEPVSEAEADDKGKKKEDKEDKSRIDWKPVSQEEEWKACAQILDRVFMILGFLAVLVLSLYELVVLPNAVNETKLIPKSPPTQSSSAL